MKSIEITQAHGRQTATTYVSRPQRLKLSALGLLAAALAGCGGGGDSGSPNTEPAATPTSPSATQPSTYTQSDVQALASKGLGAVVLSGTQMPLGVSFLGGTLVGYSLFSFGTTAPLTTACSGGGAMTYSLTKSAVRTGFIPGDQVTLEYRNCVNSGITTNGSAVLTLKNAVASASLMNYDIAYEAKLTNFSVRYLSYNATLSGVANLNSRFNSSTSMIQKISVPAGQTLKGNSSFGSIEYQAGSEFTDTEFPNPTSSQYVLNGNVVFTKGGKTTALLIATSSPLTGKSVDSQFTPSAGTVLTKDTALKLSSSAALSGTAISISGDGDDNGVMDLFVNTTWSALNP